MPGRMPSALAFFCAALLAAARPAPRARVVLDPGHGGAQEGAISPDGQLEKTVSLDVARRLKAALERVPGVQVLTPRFFNELAVRLPGRADRLVDDLAAEGIIAGVPVSRLDPDAGLDDVLLLAATELTTDEDIAALERALTKVLA